MIDREGRDRLALALRRYVIGRLTSDDLEEDTPLDWRDRGAQAVKQLAWNLYSDGDGYAVGRHAIDPTVRRDIARWIVFLHTDQEYLWPEYRFDQPDLFWWLKPDLWLGFGAFRVRESRKVAEFIAAGEADVWPFLSRQAYEEALKAPRYLCGRAA